ncbi:MAG: sigma 54-interacting transcriptional regulator [Myxococcota bacterium]
MDPLVELAGLVADPGSRERLLERALDGLRAQIPYDLAAVFVLEDRQLRLIAAAGRLDGPEVRRHTLSLDAFPTMQRALTSRRPVALDHHHHASAEGDPYRGVLDLPDGHGCLVVPLFAGGHDLGIITLDRAACGVYPAEAVEMAGLYGQLVSLALLFARQADLLDRYRFRLQERNQTLVRATGGADVAIRRLEASRSPAMRRVVELARQAARSDIPLLVLGETGTGKEVLAQAIHAWSPRADGPFVRLNCAAIAEHLVESELFGHVRGAFTGATSDRRGHFASADGGTLLLDEVGEMPLVTQAKLLRVLQEGTFHPVGSDKPVRVDVRVIAATHRDLRRATEPRTFREDLYYRLSVFPLELPPLRDRPEDVGPVARTFLDELAERTGRGPWTLGDDALAALRGARWRGNVRELVNTLERATILVPAGAIGPTHLGLDPGSRDGGAGEPAAVPSFVEAERRYFERLLAASDGRITGAGGAAERAGLNPSTLRSKRQTHGVT